ncbi:ABC-type glycerol-3-phosphate transport system substrate-binding protein [Algisphaera agarilytica]|uniref:ABC-type glycerol-3-phosphate transport system substrate-binding protein n=1 Tax=Algisphaera agarilytica TaxID=1385975 RepID=A0A7X0H6Q1_9BACT|nr:ABC-type glycerol-3-phosphate transport system substrate-binding protein [Algisphaera agarilytica]
MFQAVDLHPEFKTQESIMRLILTHILFLSCFMTGCSGSDPEYTPDGRIIVTYWEKWAGFEGDAIQSVIDDFNVSQDRIFVQRLTVSQIEHKLLLATAGGNPPDLAGLWDRNVATLAEKGALTPLNRRLEQGGIQKQDYLPSLWSLCEHRGFMWALPTTPATTALHWNKAMFREAGLDPEIPPVTLAELDEMAERLTYVEVIRGGEPVQLYYPELTEQEKAAKDFRLLRVGFNPNEPGWWNEQWGAWFGAELWDGGDVVTATHPANIEAMSWFGSYTEKYGIVNYQRFGDSTGEFASPQNPFLDGRVAMVMQGVWMYNFIDQYAPALDWGAAPFPAKGDLIGQNISLISSDVVVIPRGAKNIDEAFEFMKYLASRPAIEKLCLGHRKFSPLAAYSDSFIEDHPNPAIGVFIELASSPHAEPIPKLSIWSEYRDELALAANRVYTGLAEPEEALSDAGRRIQRKFDRECQRWALTGEQRMKEWAEQ